MIPVLALLIVPVLLDDSNFLVGAISRGASARVDLPAKTASLVVSRCMILSASL